MSEYSVQITNHSIGIQFTAFSKNELDVSQVVIDSAADKLGICTGDTLVSLNDIPITEIIKSPKYTFKQWQCFYDESLPFTATFKKSVHIEIPFIDENHEIIQDYTPSESSQTAITPSLSAYSPKTPKTNTVLNTEESKDYSESEYEVIDAMEMQKLQNGSEPKVLTEGQLLEKHIIQSIGNKNKRNIYFDSVCSCQSETEQKTHLISSNGLTNGYYEWMIEILKTDVDMQQIGVIGTKDTNEIKNNKLGAHSVFGNALSNNTIYYGSYNKDGSQRCFRNLSKMYHIGWCAGDVIKVRLDLCSWKIKFYLNGVNVRKAMSLQKGQTYYPVLSFGTGQNVEYQLVN